MDKEFLLADLESRYTNCQLCPDLVEQRLESEKYTDKDGNPTPGGKIVFGYGNPDADIMIIGECPGYDEDHTGIPFVGKSGQLLNLFLTNVMEFTADRPRETNIYITNTTLCMPPLHMRSNPTSHEMINCHNRLIEQILIIDPVAILVMGGKALSTFFGNKKKISEARGRFFTAELPGVLGIIRYPVFAVYHPSFLLRNPLMTIGGPMHQTLVQLQKFFSITDRYRYIHLDEPLPQRENPDDSQEES